MNENIVKQLAEIDSFIQDLSRIGMYLVERRDNFESKKVELLVADGRGNKIGFAINLDDNNFATKEQILDSLILGLVVLLWDKIADPNRKSGSPIIFHKDQE